MVRNYPASAAEVARDDYPFKPGIVEALRRFKAKKTFRENDRVRFGAMRDLVAELAGAEGIRCPALTCGELWDGGHSFASHYIPAEHRIVMVGKLSIITLLHEFAHALGMDERGAVAWSVSLFRRVYPRQYARLAPDGHCLVENRPPRIPRGA